MHFTQLRNFLAVADSGSIRGAARVLKISQPALTRSIRLLERELQVRLFERTARGVAVTTAGRAFSARARMIHHELGKARLELAQAAGASAGAVSFGVAPAVAMHLVPAAITQFRCRYPTADVRLMDGQSHLLLPLLRDGTLDFVVAPRPSSAIDASIKSQPLFTNRLLVGARRGHPLRRAKSLRELVDAHWVVYGSSGFPGVIPDAFLKCGLPAPKSVVRSDSYVAMISLLSGSDFVAVLGHMLFQQAPARDFFEPFDIREELPEVNVNLFTLNDSPLTPAARCMVDAVAEAARRVAFGARAA